MRDLIIAIDGRSSTGKSTLAKLLAKELGYVHIDSGAMYRAITLFALDNGLINANLVNESMLLNQLNDIHIHFEFNPNLGKNEIFLNDENVEERIREMDVSNKVSLVAKIPQIRELAVNQQRKLGENKRIVMDGRDIGTTVFPHADLKIFLTASAEERAMRRYEELLKTEHPATFDEVFQNIAERDEMDTNRKVSPLRKADDALVLDNGTLTVEETLSEVLKMVENYRNS